MRVDDVASLGPGRCGSPHYRMPFNPRNEGSRCVTKTWHAVSVMRYLEVVHSHKARVEAHGGRLLRQVPRDLRRRLPAVQEEQTRGGVLEPGPHR